MITYSFSRLTIWGLAEPQRLEPTITPHASPVNIILSTSDTIRRFRQNEVIAELPQSDEELMITVLLEHMGYQHEAPLHLKVVSRDLAADFAWGDRQEELAQCIETFAQELYEILVATGAYRRGYLFYQFLKFWGTDLLMADFETIDRTDDDNGV